jgi:hypothetical protein
MVKYSKGQGKSMALLSAFRNSLFTPASTFCLNVMLAFFHFPPQCDISVLPGGGERQKAESMLTLAESRAVNLPSPVFKSCQFHRERENDKKNIFNPQNIKDYLFVRRMTFLSTFLEKPARLP